MSHKHSLGRFDSGARHLITGCLPHRKQTGCRGKARRSLYYQHLAVGQSQYAGGHKSISRLRGDLFSGKKRQAKQHNSLINITG